MFPVLLSVSLLWLLCKTATVRVRREGGRQGGREGGREGGWEGGREGGRGVVVSVLNLSREDSEHNLRALYKEGKRRKKANGDGYWFLIRHHISKVLA